MKSVSCVWWNMDSDAPARAPYWDRGWLEDLLSGDAWRVPGAFTFDHIEAPEQVVYWSESGAGAVVIVPARQNAGNVGALQEAIARAAWVLLIATGDETDVFDWTKLSHPRMAVWKMGGRSGLMAGCAQPLGSGYPPWLRGMLHGPAPEKSRDWFFSGQANHAGRHECVNVLATMEGGKAVETDGFTQGLAQHEYASWLASAKVAPCPSGRHTPDTFRLYEALEAGCVPVVSDAGDPGYWTYLLDEPPFPVIGSWDRLPGLTAHLLDRWPANANRIGAWWSRRKRIMAYRLHKTIEELSGQTRESSSPSDEITVVIPTSPCVVHPDLDPMREVIASLRVQLPHAEVIVSADGIRDEQAKFTDVYEEYLRRLMWACHHEWSNVTVLIRDEWGHQANVTRDALNMVTTPLVLFCEHDTPLQGEIDWPGLVTCVHSGEADVVRLYPEVEIHPEHEHLMLDETPRHPHGVPLRRTVQWSQRPHLARTLWYRSVLARYFAPESRTMIEDCLYGIVEHYWREYGEPGWEQWRLWIYQPADPIEAGGIKRSTHLDTRGEEPKFEMAFVYPAEQPEGAPTPT